MLYLCLMDKELEKRWLKLPKVDVDRGEGVLTVDGEYIHLPDTTPEMVSDYIEIGHETIKDNLTEMKKMSRFWAPERSRPLILLGRLALSGEEDEVFDSEGLISVRNTEDVAIEHVLPNYRDYWETVTESLYVPVVRYNVTLNYPRFNGTWLGMRRP